MSSNDLCKRSERFEELPDEVRARLAERGIDPDRALQGFLNEIRTGRRYGELLALVKTPLPPQEQQAA